MRITYVCANIEAWHHDSHPCHLASRLPPLVAWPASPPPGRAGAGGRRSVGACSTALDGCASARSAQPLAASCPPMRSITSSRWPMAVLMRPRTCRPSIGIAMPGKLPSRVGKPGAKWWCRMTTPRRPGTSAGRLPTIKGVIMDAGDYKAYSCVGCNVQLVTSGARGRPRKRCGGCTSSSMAPCIASCYCGKTFEQRRRDHVYCSKQCKENRRNVVLPDFALCKHCGERFKPMRRASMYCGSNCKKRAWDASPSGIRFSLAQAMKEKKKVERPKWTRVYLQTCRQCQGWCGIKERMTYCSEACRNAAYRARSDAAASADRRLVSCTSTCAGCGSHMEYLRKTRRRDFCPACALKAKRSATAARRAKEKGVASETRVDPIAVLDRDGWVCKACGIDTPRSKRGTYDADAPEVDHIIPISKGGRHEYANLQCLCRSCNSSKGAKLNWIGRPCSPPAFQA